MKNITTLLTIAVLLAACAGQADLPTVTTDEVTAVTYNSATVNATVTDDGGAPIEARGVCYSTSPQPSLDNGTCTSNDRGTGTFSAEINNLSTNTTYYTRAYATNSEGTGYANELTFDVGGPQINSGPITDITYTSAMCQGSVSGLGSQIQMKGICWSTQPNPTINDNYQQAGSGDGSFSIEMDSLTAGTTYHVRVYCSTGDELLYGSSVTIETDLPLLECGPISEITDSSATCVASFSDLYGQVISKGICWSTTANPSVADNAVEDETTDNPFSLNLAGLSDGTLYYVRSYLELNSGELLYSEDVEFTTVEAVQQVVTTISATEITSNSALIKASVVEGTSANIVQAGFVFSTTQNPDTSSYVETITFSGSGNFEIILGHDLYDLVWPNSSLVFDEGVVSTSIISFGFLNSATNYFVRGFVVNSDNTVSYGNELSFTTLPTGQVGEGSGIVFFDKGQYSDGWRYLEVAPVDQSTGVAWGCMGTELGGTVISVGASVDNTNIITNNCIEINTAAHICSELDLGGHQDWSLPSAMDLFVMKRNLSISGGHWTSSEFSSQRSVSIGNSIGALGDKNVLQAVRAIRRY